MALKLIVWGTGNVGRPTIRAVLSHRDLELVGVIVANKAKVGLDAGDIASVGKTGVIATDDWRCVLAMGADAVLYRPVEAMGDLLAWLEAGINVVSSAFYAYLHPTSSPQRRCNR